MAPQLRVGIRPVSRAVRRTRAVTRVALLRPTTLYLMVVQRMTKEASPLTTLLPVLVSLIRVRTPTLVGKNIGVASAVVGGITRPAIMTLGLPTLASSFAIGVAMAMAMATLTMRLAMAIATAAMGPALAIATTAMDSGNGRNNNGQTPPTQANGAPIMPRNQFTSFIRPDMDHF